MNYLQLLESKFYKDTQSLVLQRAIWQKANKTVIFTNGCFDILHKGHITYLAKAALLGDILIIGLNDDYSVEAQQKDPNRPLQDESSRALVLSALLFVNAVILFNQATPLELIKLLTPDILVKGSDYKLKDIVGAKEVLAYGGRVETIELVAGYSTTAIAKKMVK